MEHILNKENTGLNLPGNPMKNGAPNSVIKKNVLGKLDNVMLQTPKITPFKRNLAGLEGSIAKLSLRKTNKPIIVSKDREETNVRATNCYLGAYMLKCEPQTINLFNYTDFPNEQCLKKCGKPITETWSDNQSGYEGLFNQLYCDLRTWENNLENVFLPPLKFDFDDFQCSNYTERTEIAESKYVLDLFAPMPNFESIDILF
ncbi:uncharacterized protein LOC108141707 [Drosophila elegans]|uniref:uncharacterized protein LOC108141707 n=1 Tax=Drosophila elegans TaxID=30023 RepID=UPI001BC837F0|nr:uncharacterized protein LOC108141707 [Drosophila elegans]